MRSRRARRARRRSAEWEFSAGHPPGGSTLTVPRGSYGVHRVHHEQEPRGDNIGGRPNVVAELTARLRTLHEDNLRQQAIGEIWAMRNDLRSWIATSMSGTFVDDALPTLLMGGASRGKLVVVTVNPGEPIDGETALLRRSRQSYIEFHDQFFTAFPGLLAAARTRPAHERRKDTSPYWNNLRRYLAAFEPMRPNEDKWQYYARVCVAQDLIPFHSRVKRHDIRRGGPLRDIARATLDGIASSRARGVLLLSRHAFDLVEDVGVKFQEKTINEDFTATQRRSRPPKRNSARSVSVRIGAFGNVPFVAVDNDLVSQPTFPWTSGYESALASIVAKWPRRPR